MRVLLVFLVSCLLVSSAISQEFRCDLVVSDESVRSTLLPLAGDLRHFLGASSTGLDVRVYRGDVPKISRPSSTGAAVETAIIFSKTRKRAVVRTIFVDPSGKMEVDESPWFATKHTGKWEVSEGQGSIGTQERVAAFLSMVDSCAFPRRVAQVSRLSPGMDVRYGGPSL